MADDAKVPRRPRRPKAPTTPDPIEIAMEAVANPDLAAPVREVLLSQKRLIDWQARGERAAVFLRLLTAGAGLAVAAGLGLMVWNATHANGVVIRSFSVPPEMADQGVTGEVLAQEFRDHINVQQVAAAGTAMRRSTFADEQGGSALRLEIPQTGVSLGDLDRMLRAWLGHERIISGNLTLAGETSALTVRLASLPAVSVSGPADDRGALVRAAAERIFAQADPNGATFYLRNTGRRAELEAVLSQMRDVGSPKDRSGAFAFSANHAMTTSPVQAVSFARQAIALDPSAAMPWRELNRALHALGRWESARTANCAAQDRLAQVRRDPDFAEGSWQKLREGFQAVEAAYTGDFHAALSRVQARLDIEMAQTRAAPEGSLATLAVLAHELPEAVGQLERARLRANDDWEIRAAGARLHAANGRWTDANERFAAALTASPPPNAFQRASFLAEAAVAAAMAGDRPAAEALLRPTSPDCYPCLRARGRIAAIAGDRESAERWFAEAVRQGPSLPFAYAEWAGARLAFGDVEGALALLREAKARGPKWADPLKLEGDALMRLGQPRDAARSYRKAIELAPRWGAAHVGWVRALATAGDAAARRRRDETARLALTRTERADLDALKL